MAGDQNEPPVSGRRVGEVTEELELIARAKAIIEATRYMTLATADETGPPWAFTERRFRRGCCRSARSWWMVDVSSVPGLTSPEGDKEEMR